MTKHTMMTVAGLLAMLSGTVAAAELGAYAGVNYAQTDKDADSAVFADNVLAIYDALLLFTPETSSTRFDKEDSSYGFVVGYRLHENLAVEGGYMDLGDVKYRDRSTGTVRIPDPGGGPDQTEPASFIQNIDSSTSGIMASVLGILPLSYRWEVYARAGLLLAGSEVNVFLADETGSLPLQNTKSHVDLLAGVGTSLLFLDVYTLRLEFQRVFDAGHEDTLEAADLDLLAVGITVRF
jgi:OmpA family protein